MMRCRGPALSSAGATSSTCRSTPRRPRNSTTDLARRGRQARPFLLDVRPQILLDADHAGDPRLRAGRYGGQVEGIPGAGRRDLHREGGCRRVSPAERREVRRYPDRPIVGVLAVVMRGDRVLVVRRTNPPMPGRWGFPGGVLELGETVAQGAMRELLEETSVVAEGAGPLTVIDTIDRDHEGRIRYHYTLVAVIGHWRSGEGAPGDD